MAQFRPFRLYISKKFMNVYFTHVDVVSHIDLYQPLSIIAVSNLFRALVQCGSQWQ